MIKSFAMLGVRINPITKSDFSTWLDTVLQTNSYHWIATINAEILLHANADIKFTEVLNSSDLNIIDGSGPQYLAHMFLGKRISRLPGVDLCDMILHQAHTKKVKVLFLGGREKKNGILTTELTAQFFRKKYPGIEIMIEQGGELLVDEKAIHMDESAHKRIQAFAPDIALVAATNPVQEVFVSRQHTAIPSLKLGIGIGGSFNMYAGLLPRAPKAFRVFGLESLWRLLLEPTRYKRIFRAIFVFPAIFLYRLMVPRFRPNVAICVRHTDGTILIAKRCDLDNHWQFPQGGIELGDSVCETAYRELAEEVGIEKKDITHIKETNETHSYIWPKNTPETTFHLYYQGQKQTIVIAEYIGKKDAIKVDNGEFCEYTWVTTDMLLESVHPYRQSITRLALKHL